MRSKLVQSLGLMLVSLVLAFFFWAVATEAEDPQVARTYPVSIPVERQGVPEGMVAYGAENIKARVSLRAPQSIWDILQLEDIRAFVDLSDVGPGPVTVPIQVEVHRKPVQVVQSSPQELSLFLEPLVERDIPVEVELEGHPALGFMARQPTFAPHTVTVSGPQPLISQVVRSLVTVPVDEQQEDVSGDFVSTPVDETGKRVDYVQVLPRAVTVQVTIEQLANIRNLPVRIVLAGQPAPGYRIGSVEIEPPVISVFGRSDVLQNALDYLETELVPLDGASSSFTTTSALQVPEGLTVLLTPQVMVKVNLEPVESKMTVQLIPEIQGLGAGLTTTLVPGTVQLLLVGPFEAVEQLDPAGIQLSLDLTDLPPGEYTITPDISLPDDRLRIEGIFPQSSLPVRIEEIPRP
ncbi:MAG: hypothetical protein J7M17_06950 [Anaerolineae bacterium]|nr:hypothetical protein [Anaerolineae bacterium]